MILKSNSKFKSKRRNKMSVVKMSAHRALSELKLFDKRIEKGCSGTFIAANKVSNKMIAGRNVEDTKSLIKANFQSMTTLIENRKRIKSALVKSNSSTVVTIGGKEYTVAEAVERKNSVQLDQAFLNTLKQQFTQSNNLVEQQNGQLQTKLETYLQSVLGEKSNRTSDDVKAHTKVFEDSNKFELVDPNKVADYVNKYEKEIDGFISEVDYSLSESNATTFFEVDLMD
jgi:hypothetical protein